MGFVQRLSVWGELVTFSHSVFALPFALIMVVHVSDTHPVRVAQISLLVLCVVMARTAAMAFNRYVDAEIDARNPRTNARSIPRGVVSKGGALTLVLVSSGVFLGGSAALGARCLALAPIVLIILLGYSFVKRFSALCHMVLGVALSLAPGGVWLALTGEWSWRPVPLMTAVALWVAGFDVLYSCQDIDFDRSSSLHSVPSVVGIRGARLLSLLLHCAALIALAVHGRVFGAGVAYGMGVVVFGALLMSQHLAVMRHGISCVNQVFLTRNGAASVLLLLFVIGDSLL
jgi:4-hydroxybenzoate polyprenyltransferase